jgi:hypothetical protein
MRLDSEWSNYRLQGSLSVRRAANVVGENGRHGAEVPGACRGSGNRWRVAAEGAGGKGVVVVVVVEE